MLKFFTICLLTVFTVATAKPQWLVPSTYTAPVGAIAAPSVALAAPSFVEPYYASYAVTPWWSSYAAYPYAGSYW
ncbi:uncharacterized protein LOC110118145 [Ceratitis capitata]|uniref:(Mediterranean fruit fly) hypothetical protein n=1 Tax=Ceratitis capitata TaxID=7213 RepID=A0A811UWT0_CERCA|nr:uncharacterized protein LOC110118145 [Ceratitis capitata]CAD7003390.1 unnamed protein product [Ceratitis capitata]